MKPPTSPTVRVTDEVARRLAERAVREWDFDRLYDYCATLRAEEYLEDHQLFWDDWEVFCDDEELTELASCEKSETKGGSR